MENTFVNLDVLLSSRLKPADTLTGLTTVTSLTQMNGQAISMGTGVRDAGTQRVTIATNDVVPASQSGTWTVQPGNTANTTAWKVDGSAVTQPVSAASLPLPTGASTAAKQPALGTAGVASADVITIQGVASMTKILTTPDNPSNLDVALSTRLKPADTLTGITTVTTVTSLTQMNGAAISMNTGVRDAGTQRVTIATNDVVPASQSGTWTVQPGNTANTTAWKVDGSAVTQPVSGTFWQATQPVSQATATSLRISGGDAAGSPTAGTVLAVQGIASGTAVPVSGTFWQATQPVSGTFWQTTQPVSGTFWQATQPTSNPSGNRTDTYTATGNGVTVTATNPFRAYALQVVGTGGSAATWDIRLEGSLDNVNFDQILQHTNATGDGKVVFSGTELAPSLYIRSRAASLALGLASNVVATIVGIQ